MPETPGNDAEHTVQNQAGLAHENEEEGGTLSPELKDLAGKAVE